MRKFMKVCLATGWLLAATGLMLPLKVYADNSGKTQSAKTDNASSPAAANALRSDKTAATPAAAGAALSPTDASPSLAKTDAFVPIEWITIPGGKFMMGSDDAVLCSLEGCPAQPVHEVTIKTFQMAKTLVTVEQYAQCVRAKKCTESINKGQRLATDCNWGKAGRERHPVNSVDWNQANQYIKFVNESQHMHARLPSEAEWEYAARSGGKDQKYPWGNEEPNCDRAVMYDEKKGGGCGANGTMPVCSKPAGNTKQGLCDMAGNVCEWMQDNWHDSYAGAPADGSAWEGARPARVLRGGRWDGVVENGGLRSALRLLDDPYSHWYAVGLRLVRSSP